MAKTQFRGLILIGKNALVSKIKRDILNNDKMGIPTPLDRDELKRLCLILTNKASLQLNLLLFHLLRAKDQSPQII